MLIDSHLHLDFDAFGPDRDAVLARAAAAGIETLLTIGVRVRDADRVLKMAERYPNVWATVGTHPHFADDEPDVTAAEIVALTGHPKVVGIGEAGLDTFLGNAAWEAQIAAFRANIEASRITQLPLVIHSVRQDEAMAAMLTEESRKGVFPFLIHAFSGGQGLLDAALALGGYFGIGGLLTFPDYGYLRDLVPNIPADRLLLETDSPSLAPVPHLDERNEPAHLLHSLALLSELREADFDALGAQTTENFYRLFTKVRRPAEMASHHP